MYKEPQNIPQNGERRNERKSCRDPRALTSLLSKNISALQNGDGIGLAEVQFSSDVPTDHTFERQSSLVSTRAEEAQRERV